MVKVVCYVLLKKVKEIRGERAGSEQGRKEVRVRRGRRTKRNLRRLAR